MKLHEKPRMPRGFTCAGRNCGIKDEGRDLSVFYSEVRAHAAGVFTRNKFPGAPIILGREIIKGGSLRAIIVNSKVSNVGTGELGIKNARRMATAVSREFGIPENEVIMSSTGVIATHLPIEIVEKGVQGISKELSDDPLVGAMGIMTTDTYPKALSVSIDEAVITVQSGDGGKGCGPSLQRPD